MKYIIGADRNQITIFPISLEESIDAENEVRFIDIFVESPDKEMGFKATFFEIGRPAYHPKALLKLYIYGYMNRTRSSRELEKETKRNIEVMWPLKGLSPDHNTIANYRKENPETYKNDDGCSTILRKISPFHAHCFSAKNPNRISYPTSKWLIFGS